MKAFIRLLISFVVAMSFYSCSDEEGQQKTCSIPATVVDLTGLDACGFAFELEDGTILLPQAVFFCGTPPVPDNLPQDVLAGFQYIAGKKVFLEYNELEGVATACQAGIPAHITCIQERVMPAED